ncbi:hypothetical protein C0Q70_18593 [Pomacea canaliculata]|uniref:Sodium/hydrogen exchanger n=1 Tax=Pomacea canaliculata TaxID=400727 RepID=A0A2T7NH05_POMCA|nr:hypothetical protein C0Q70_18593 [Pomacea canaliculata]
MPVDSSSKSGENSNVLKVGYKFPGVAELETTLNGFHLYDRLSSIFPESCLLIVMGIAVGAVLHFSHAATASQYVLNANTFFLFVLPPIIYDAGYHMPLRAFFNNLGTILLLAIVNTLWNTVAIGASLWAASCAGWIARKISILHCFIFSALISAVDPVAVLAVFEDVHVNEMLYIIVFGESLLNDGVTVVLYHMMEGYTEIGEGNIQPVDYVAGVGSFFIIALGGTVIGVIYGMVGGFITKYTDHVQIIEPLFVFILGYLAYLTAEMMHLSGILALTFGGITMRHYAEANMSEKSITAVKYTMKMMANVSETVMFMFLGLSTVVDTLEWQWDFIFFSIIFCIIYRVIGIVGLVFLLNRRRLIRLTGIDQFIMSYGGLRGGIAFCLSLLINEELVPEKKIFVTTTILVVFFTVFVQGITIKPVVNALKVKRAQEKDPAMNEMINERLIDHIMAGMEDIVGRTTNNSIKNRFEHFNMKFLKPVLLREKPQTRETHILSVFSKLNVRDALHHISSHGGFINPLSVQDSSITNKMNKQGSSNSIEPSGDVYYKPAPAVYDIHSVEAVFSKKDVEDSHIHHVLVDAMTRSHKMHIERRHSVEDAPQQRTSHHQMHPHLHRLISLQHLHNESQDKPTSKDNTAICDTAMTTDEMKITQIAVNCDTAVTTDETKLMHKDEVSDCQEQQNEDDAGSVASTRSAYSQKDSEEPESLPPEETEVERVLPWRRQTQLPPVPSSVSLSMPDDEHPLMSQAPSWADNLAYNHLTESGSPYISPQNTISANQPASSHRPIFDIFPPADGASPNGDSSLLPSSISLPPAWVDSLSFPPPWASGSDDEPITSPQLHDGGDGEKASTYLASSSHKFYPPSHHSVLVSQDGEVGESHGSNGSMLIHPANSPKHFQPIKMHEMCSRQGIEAEIICDESSYQEGLVFRVQRWLDSNDPSEACDEDADEGQAHAEGHDCEDDGIDLGDTHLETHF